jgi:hypothetical protein
LYISTRQWGASANRTTFNGILEARGSYSKQDETQNITWKELKAFRHAVLSFLPHLGGRNILLYEETRAVCCVLAGLDSFSPEMMEELRRL